MKIVFAIGNPGLNYKYTYHNLGILFSDYLIQNSLVLEQKITKKYIFYRLNNYNVVQSNVYMNCSFEALREIFVFYKLKSEDILVVHDELNLNKYSIKLKYTEGLGGHNGLRDIARNIGPKFARLKIGIDHPKNFNDTLDVSSYVLSKLNIDEWKNTFDKGLIELAVWL